MSSGGRRRSTIKRKRSSAIWSGRSGMRWIRRFGRESLNRALRLRDELLHLRDERQAVVRLADVADGGRALDERPELVLPFRRMDHGRRLAEEIEGRREVEQGVAGEGRTLKIELH